MKLKTTMILLLCCCMQLMVHAQSLSNSERRHILSKALDLIQEYESSQELQDEDAVYVFKLLFSSKDVQVLCDLPGTSAYLSEISLAKYLELLEECSVSTSMGMSNVRKGELKSDGEDWILPIYFDKSISYVDNNGIIFSTDDVNESDIKMKMELRYDKSKDKCTIDSIEGKASMDMDFLKTRFYVVESSFADNLNKKVKKYAHSLTVNGNPLVFNENGQAFLPAGQVSARDPEVIVESVVQAKGNNYDKISFNITPPKVLRLKARFGFAPAGAYGVNSSDRIGSKSSALEFGLDFGMTWPLGKINKFGVFAGVGLNNSSLNLFLAEPISYSYNTLMPDSDPPYYSEKNVKFDLESASESVSFTDLVIPIYVGMEHVFGKSVMLSWDLGIKAYYNMGTKLKKAYSVQGRYNVGGISDSFDTEFSEFLAPISYKRSPYDISAAANLSIDVNIYKRRYYAYLNIGYEYGITQSYQAQGRNEFYVDGLVYPVLTHSHSGDLYALHSMMSCTSYRRQALWIGLGIKIKM